MSASEKDLQILKHILEHCNRVTASTERFGKDYDSFSADCDYQDSVNLNLALGSPMHLSPVNAVFTGLLLIFSCYNQVQVSNRIVLMNYNKTYFLL